MLPLPYLDAGIYGWLVFPTSYTGNKEVTKTLLKIGSEFPNA